MFYQVFDRKNGNAVVGTIAGLKNGVYTVNWGPDNMFAVAGGDHAIRIYQVDDSSLDYDEESKGEAKE